jgi:uncharacterized membrane protein YhhN
MLTLLSKYLQTWTPLSVIVIIVAAAMVFLVIWDSLHGLPIPAFVYSVLAFITGGAGGVTVASSTVKQTVTAVTQAQNGHS